MKLRPYKSCDAPVITGWIRDEDTFRKWGGGRFDSYPLTPAMLDEKYRENNGDCAESDNFYPWTALSDDSRPVGHFIMRYLGGDPARLRFGWVIVDASERGKGIGKEMLSLGLEYAFKLLGAESVTLGVFECNEPAHRCYRSAGFRDAEEKTGDPWHALEMELRKEDYFSGKTAR